MATEPPRPRRGQKIDPSTVEVTGFKVGVAPLTDDELRSSPVDVTGAGAKSDANSSTDTLSGSAEFTGAWEVNNFEHAAVNVLADVDGELIVEFGIPLASGSTLDDSDVLTTFASTRPIYAGQGYFRPIVKMPGRAFRVRYVNGASAQTEFGLLTAYGNNQFPASASDDNELLTTVTERERNVFVAYAKQNVAANGYAVLVDLSDTTNFPHSRVGRIDLSATYFQVDKQQNATGAVRLGVITRVNGTDADVTFVQGVRFDKSNERHINRDRNYAPSQLKLGVEAGSANRALGVNETGITAINTGLTLDSPAGAVTPAVGDVVIGWEQGTANFDFAVSAFYHGETTP